jgi:hypothetical protein
MWAIAQISTGIIVACCPHLRPIFEKILPHRLTRLSTRKSKNALRASELTQTSGLTLGPPEKELSRNASITVTTDIAVQGTGPLPATPVEFHDGKVESWGPTFDVERGPANRLRLLTTCCGDPCPC